DRASQRLLKLQFDRGERLTYFPPAQGEHGEAAVEEQPAPGAPAPGAGAGQRARGGAAGEKAGAPQSKPAAPVETLYHTVFRDNVVLSQEGRELTADQLDVGARLLDNKLPEGGVGTRNLPEASVSRVGAGVMDPLTLAVAGAIAQSGDGPQGQEQDGERGEQAPITLTWTGPLSV